MNERMKEKEVVKVLKQLSMVRLEMVKDPLHLIRPYHELESHGIYLSINTN
jgi:hypothetical protein